MEKYSPDRLGNRTYKERRTLQDGFAALSRHDHAGDDDATRTISTVTTAWRIYEANPDLARKTLLPVLANIVQLCCNMVQF